MRASGILAHPTSLAGAYGTGDLGEGTTAFLEFLQAAGQSLWQVLPLTPTGFGNSPYTSTSAFAGNALLIGIDPLLEEGLLQAGDVDELRQAPADHLDFSRVLPLKEKALRRAFERFGSSASPARAERFEAFRSTESTWLQDYALFAALREHLAKPWTEWHPGLRDREAGAVAEARRTLEQDVAFQEFQQFLFFDQWDRVRQAANAAGIKLVGDIPIFVAHDSADVWTHPKTFKLDEHGNPRVMAGVPPDYFSATGQLWGNPLYDWQTLKADNYGWWVRRFAQLARLVDVVRVDHFRGFAAAWEVPAGQTTAVGGKWVPGPGADVFRAVHEALGDRLDVIAEDLGLIDDAVRELLSESGFPGMKVLQFAFDGDTENPYLPHNYADDNCVVYTGTHDNDTTLGWYGQQPAKIQARVQRYTASDGRAVVWDLIRLAEASVASMAVIPLQDVLELDSAARMNRPGAAEGNWLWRMPTGSLTDERAEHLRDLTRLFGRLPGDDLAWDEPDELESEANTQETAEAGSPT